MNLKSINRLPITHVAIRFKGITYSLPSPNRHHHIIRLIIEKTGTKYVDSREEDQGFLDQSGRYLNRKQALLSAKVNNQIKDLTQIRCNMLFSEDLW
jgi:hypothetical protein